MLRGNGAGANGDGSALGRIAIVAISRGATPPAAIPPTQLPLSRDLRSGTGIRHADSADCTCLAVSTCAASFNVNVWDD